MYVNRNPNYSLSYDQRGSLQKVTLLVGKEEFSVGEVVNTSPSNAIHIEGFQMIGQDAYAIEKDELYPVEDLFKNKTVY